MTVRNGNVCGDEVQQAVVLVGGAETEHVMGPWSTLLSRTHLRSGEIYVVGLDHEGLGMNLAQALPQLRVLG